MNMERLATMERCIRDCQHHAKRDLTFHDRVMLCFIVLDCDYREAASICAHVSSYGFVTLEELNGPGQ